MMHMRKEKSAETSKKNTTDIMSGIKNFLHKVDDQGENSPKRVVSDQYIINEFYINRISLSS